MSHSYEEIRSAAIDVLAGRHKDLKWGSDPSQYENLRLGVAEVLAKSEGRFDQTAHYQPPFDGQDGEIFLEVFWELFRQGFITLGSNNANREFPWFKVTDFGKRMLDGRSPYFFHDVSSYENVLRKEVPNLNDVTLLYLKEAMQAFRTGCLLSSTVMLGVAAEHTFLLLLEAIAASPKHATMYASAAAERTILQKLTKFRNILDQNLQAVPKDIKEDLDIHFAGIQSVIRTFRNQAGHPTGTIPNRENTFVLLQLYVTYCKKLYRMIDYFSK